MLQNLLGGFGNLFGGSSSSSGSGSGLGIFGLGGGLPFGLAADHR
jgi:hypothetical protein